VEASVGLLPPLEKFIIREDVSGATGEWLIIGSGRVALPAGAVTFAHALGTGVDQCGADDGDVEPRGVGGGSNRSGGAVVGSGYGQTPSPSKRAWKRGRSATRKAVTSDRKRLRGSRRTDT
jgi:hypothetical protein